MDKNTDNKYYLIALLLLALWGIVAVWLVFREMNMLAIAITPVWWGVALFLLLHRTSITGQRHNANSILWIICIIAVIALYLLLSGKQEAYKSFMHFFGFPH